jgi:hypothetical protein
MVPCLGSGKRPTNDARLVARLAAEGKIHRDIRRSIKRALVGASTRKSRPQPDSTTPASSLDKHRSVQGLLRQYLPRRLDFRTLTQADFNAIAQQLNERPRQTLAFKTPSQSLVSCAGNSLDI